MLNPKIALIPGSFDPVTIGHYDIVCRAAAMFDEVYVVSFINSSKKDRFSPEQRLEMLKTAFSKLPNVNVDISQSLLAGYAFKHNAGTIVKGSRSATDFDYEMSLSLINRSINKNLDTIILPTKAEYMHISSTMVCELIRYGMDYSKCVPEGVGELIRKYTK